MLVTVTLKNTTLSLHSTQIHQNNQNVLLGAPSIFAGASSNSCKKTYVPLA
ncbi:hypothetical protein JHK82_047941 [Glycine max]|nr:hypothetical protein JHK82_047941 [Glycine max]